MSVHRRVYRPYEGEVTSERWRFLVLPRYALLELFESRLLTAFVVMCLLPFVVEALGVYVAHSAAAQALLQMAPDAAANVMRPEFFLGILIFQGVLAFLLTSWVAPVLVSPDLVNGALPLYLSRPFSRTEYVLGKASVLALLLSAITWVPTLLLFALQAGLDENGWGRANLRVAFAVLAGAWIWIAVLTLLGLAVSAWIRWRIVATGALFGVFGMGGAFGEMWHEVLGSPWGRLVNLTYVVNLVWRRLFGILGERSLASEMLDDRRARDLPAWSASLALVAVCLFSMWLLDRRLRAREVVS